MRQLQILTLVLLGMLASTGCGDDGVTPPPNCLPTLVSPADGAVLDNGCSQPQESPVWNFDWVVCDRASTYHLQIMKDGAAIPLFNDSTLTSTSYRFSESGYVTNDNLLGWKWRVRARVRGLWSAWAERSFDVEPLNTDCP